MPLDGHVPLWPFDTEPDYSLPAVIRTETSARPQLFLLAREQHGARIAQYPALCRNPAQIFFEVLPGKRVTEVRVEHAMGEDEIRNTRRAQAAPDPHTGV